MGMRLVFSFQVSPRLDLVPMLSFTVAFVSSTQARDRNCVNMAKGGLIGEKKNLTIFCRISRFSFTRGWQVC